MVETIVWFVAVCLSVVAAVYLARPHRSEYYCLCGVALLVYAVTEATVIIADDSRTSVEMIIGLGMVAIPALIWAIPIKVKLPWMDAVFLSDK